jgi:4a-hydroxytetrahydrobiopterin dehydratase
MDKLSKDQVKLGEPWRFENNALVAGFKFKDFKAAWSFMTRVAKLADEMNHHPDWSNVYNQVSIRLSTHEAGGVTALDTKLAEAISHIHQEFFPSL